MFPLFMKITSQAHGCRMGGGGVLYRIQYQHRPFQNGCIPKCICPRNVLFVLTRKEYHNIFIERNLIDKKPSEFLKITDNNTPMLWGGGGIDVGFFRKK